MPKRAWTLATAVLTALALAGCAERSLPVYEPPLRHSSVMNVRTTAYTDTESDHLRYGNSSAVGGTLQNGALRSAAADWSRWPAGTQFFIPATGQTYEVDDYGWALSGRNTIDLYCPSRSEMNLWGVRRVTIQILRWGDPWRSYRLLRSRDRYPHVHRMLGEIRQFYHPGRSPEIAPAKPGRIAAAPVEAPPPATPVGSAQTTQVSVAPTEVRRAEPTPAPAGDLHSFRDFRAN